MDGQPLRFTGKSPRRPLAEGLAAYRRFRQLLATSLGIQPSEETETLRSRLTESTVPAETRVATARQHSR